MTESFSQILERILTQNVGNKLTTELGTGMFHTIMHAHDQEIKNEVQKDKKDGETD